MNRGLWIACLIIMGAAARGQVCTAGTQLQNDSLPANPAGMNPVAVIQGICPGDKAGAVFDVSAFGSSVKVNDCGILFAGPAGSQAASGRLEIYDGVVFAPNGAATLGSMVYQSPGPLPYMPNTLGVVNIAPSNVMVTSGTLVVVFTMDVNPNANVPFLGCLAGYFASFASDTTVAAGTPCTTPPQTNLIFDPSQGWWDVTGFQIGGTNWCGAAFNGNWVIRACVESNAPPCTYPGTGEDLLMTSAVGLTALNAIDVKTVTAGDFVTVLVSSPGGGFVGGHIIVVAEAFPTGNPPVSPFPGIVVSATASTTLVAGAGASPFGNPLLSPIGFAVSFNVPSGLVGVSGVFQGIVPSIVAANGIFGSTCGFEFQVM